MKKILSFLPLVAMLVTLAYVMDSGPKTLGTFTTDNLIVNTLATIKGGSITTRAGSPNGIVTATEGSLIMDTSTPALWQNIDGATLWNQINVVTLGSGSISMTAGSATSPINLSTTGTIDWFSATMVGNTSSRTITCPLGTSNVCHEKLHGEGRLITPGTDYIGVWNSSGTVSGLWTFTSTAADDLATSGGAPGLSSPTVAEGSTTGGTGMGIRFLLPSPGGNVQRVARLFMYQYDNVTTCTAIALDGSSLGSAVAVDTGSGGIVAQNVFTITYKVNTLSYVEVDCIITAIRTGVGNPAMGYAGVTIGST